MSFKKSLPPSHLGNVQTNLTLLSVCRRLSIVKRLGGFWCCKDKTFIWIVQGFWKKVRKWRWFLTDVGCFGRPGDCPLSSSTACSILHQSMTRAIFPSLSCCHRRTHGNSTTVRYLATMCQISHATRSNLT